MDTSKFNNLSELVDLLDDVARDLEFEDPEQYEDLQTLIAELS